MTLGEQLRMRRKELGMRQADIAKKFGVSRQTYIMWENDEAKPRAKYADEVYKFIGESIDVSDMNDMNDASHDDIWDSYTIKSHIEERITYLKRELSTMQRILRILKEEG